eukprot:gene17243-23776_t
MDANNLEITSQHLKDFKLAIEFKYLMKNSPAGVYLMPEFENIRRLHGVIFLRRGLYREGVFRFIISLPSGYNDVNTHPQIFFTPPIFNPLIDPATGQLDLKLDDFLKEWQPERHFIVTAITFLKKIFYMKSFDEYPIVANEEAKIMFKNDKDEFLARVKLAVDESLQRVHDPQSNNCTMIFTERKPAHEDIIRKILLQSEHENHDNVDSYTGLEVDQDGENVGDLSQTRISGLDAYQDGDSTANISQNDITAIH